jgi:hypothetical protein
VRALLPPFAGRHAHSIIHLHLALVHFGFAHREVKFGAVPENPEAACDVADPGASAIARMPRAFLGQSRCR